VKETHRSTGKSIEPGAGHLPHEGECWATVSDFKGINKGAGKSIKPDAVAFRCEKWAPLVLNTVKVLMA
jgi:hypothetical protein